jgi:RNA polymerase sigma-70 factor (ECF subfamily)
MDRDELLGLYPAHRGRLVAALSRLVEPAQAEDLAQETLLRALSAVDGFRGEAALGTWLHRIAVNLAYDHLRRKDALPVVPTDEEDAAEPDAAPSAEEGLDQRQMGRCVDEVLTTLPPQYRDVLLKADVLDHTAAEIACVTGISTGNAKIRLHRARRAMKAALEAHCDFHHREPGVLCCTPKPER